MARTRYTGPAPETLTAQAEATIAAVRAAGVEVISWTPAPVVNDPAALPALLAGEERFYDVLLDIWTGIIAREMATQDATCEAIHKESSVGQAHADAAGAR